MTCGAAVNGQGEGDLEPAASVRFTFHGDLPAHQVNDVFRDGHAQTGALHLVGGGAFRTGEGVENVGQEFRCHAAAVVGDNDADGGLTGDGAGKLGDVKADRAAVGRVFYRVGQQIDQYLPQTHAVTNEELMRHIMGADHEVLRLFRRTGTDDAVDLTDLLGKAYRLPDNADLSRLDLAHVQHIVDEGQHMLAGGVSFADVIAHFVRHGRLAFHQAGNAQNGVHRRADVVGHVGEEFALGAVGGLGLPRGGLRQLYRGGKLRVLLVKLAVDGGKLVVIFPLDGKVTLLTCRQDNGDYNDTGNDQNDGKGKDHPVRGVHQQHDILRHIVRRHQKQKRPVRVVHLLQGVVVFIPVQHRVGVGKAAAVELTLGGLKGGVVEIGHLLQRGIGIIAQQRVVTAAEDAPAVLIQHIDAVVIVIGLAGEEGLQLRQTAGQTEIGQAEILAAVPDGHRLRQPLQEENAHVAPAYTRGDEGYPLRAVHQKSHFRQCSIPAVVGQIIAGIVHRHQMALLVVHLVQLGQRLQIGVQLVQGGKGMILDGAAENVCVLPPAAGHVVQPLEELDGDLLHLLLPFFVQDVVDIPVIEPHEYEKGDADQQQKCGQRKGQGPNQISFRIHTVSFHFVLLPADIGP